MRPVGNNKPGPTGTEAHRLAMVEKALRKHRVLPAQGGASLDSKGNSTSYITDDGMRLVNPDGPEFAEQIKRDGERIERLEAALADLAWAAGDLNIATDGVKALRTRRLAVLRALKKAETALAALNGGDAA